MSKRIKKYKIFLIIVAILWVSSVITLSSYAMWQIKHTQSDTNKIMAGCFKMNFTEKSGSINLINTYPMNNSDGELLTPYEFSVKNDCSLGGKYQIILNVGDKSTMDLSKIKINLTKKNYYNDLSENTTFLTSLTKNIELDPGIIDSYILKEDYLISLDEINEYSIRLWVDSSADNNQMNKKLDLEISIKSVAIEDYDHLELSENNSSFGPLTKFDVEKIRFLTTKEVPSDAIESWDMSEKKNGSIIAWYKDEDNNGKYEAFIGQDGGVIANPNSSYLFRYFAAIKEIDLTNFDTSKVTNMSYMFCETGWVAESLKINLTNFNTENVTNMFHMFDNTGAYGTDFQLDISSFDTSKVTNMEGMFYYTGWESETFTLNLGRINTSKVTNMSYMFCETGFTNPNFNIDVSNFDTSNVENMSSMFYETGIASKTIQLNLSNFNTKRVTSMSHMFSGIGLNNPNFTLDVSAFDTSKVTDMSNMFINVGSRNPDFSLNLSNFDTNNVIDMTNMFYYNTNPNFKLNIKNFTLDKLKLSSGMFSNMSSTAKIYSKNKTTINVLKSTTDFPIGLNIIDCSTTTCP